MKRALEELIWRRAGNRCEYCHLPSNFSTMLFEIDHIVAQQHGGDETGDNLALACFACNHHKGPNLAGVDPHTGKRTWLFHPRLQNWKSHFKWRGALLTGKSAVGRCTIAVLAINTPVRLAQRTALMKAGKFPRP